MSQTCIRLTLPEEEKKSGGGFLHQFSVGETYPLHTHAFFELFLVSKGKAVHCVNNATQLLTEGSFVLIRPEDVHRYDFFNQYDFELINISFLKDAFDTACSMLSCPGSSFLDPALSPHIILEGYSFTDMKRKLLQLNNKKEGLPRKQYLLSLLPFFLYSFLTEPDRVTANASIPLWLAGLLKKMEDPENFVPGLPRLLELSNMSQEHLTRAFRKYLDMTPTEFINTKRVNFSIQLLLETDSDVITVCHECGFHNLSHFYRIFHKQFECSPKKFLERYQGRR